MKQLPPRLRLTRAANHDVEAILHDTGERFGDAQVDVYADILRLALERIAADPLRPGTRLIKAAPRHIRAFAVNLAARRRTAARHVLFFELHDDGTVVVLRVLHDRMDPSRHLSD